jgi:hypothetical protein
MGWKSANISAKDAIPEIKALKVKVLKPTDKQYGIIDINSGNENYENFYKEYLSITNDPTLKESLTLLIITSKPESGKPSPKFDYENKGRKTSLESLKANVYIDVWATCGPLSSRSTIQKKWKNNIKVKY